ncbi:zinc-binding dehydrogenase [Actinomadura sp. BRA 177]|uniref:zinc-binding dehydrogenase n=1 Tax=Actinomadura sp. BRA 177 TaxID=2745202 RepID=UPI0034D97F69
MPRGTWSYECTRQASSPTNSTGPARGQTGRDATGRHRSRLTTSQSWSPKSPYGTTGLAAQLARDAGAHVIATGRARSAAKIKPGGTLVTITAPPADGRAVFFIVEPDHDQLTELAERADSGRLRAHVGAVYSLAETRAAFEAKHKSVPARSSSKSDPQPPYRSYSSHNARACINASSSCSPAARYPLRRARNTNAFPSWAREAADQVVGAPSPARRPRTAGGPRGLEHLTLTGDGGVGSVRTGHGVAGS